MKRWLPILMLVVGVGSTVCFGQAATTGDDTPNTPFFLYIKASRANQIDPAAMKFAADCGVSLTGIRAKKAFSNDEAGTWHVVASLSKAYEGLEMDDLGTAEVWKVDGRFVVEKWNVALDVGGFERELYCFDDPKTLRMFDATNFQVPTDDTKPWGMHERWSLNAEGKFVAAPSFHFVGLDGQQIPTPKLGKDDKTFVKSWSKRFPQGTSTNDLGLPPELFS